MPLGAGLLIIGLAKALAVSDVIEPIHSVDAFWAVMS
ncbi:hypothetical protein M2302_004785 [Micromonospora sp. A200]|nr:hypothetical protein [Micromonospora sp. A200]